MNENKLFKIALCLDLISVKNQNIKELRLLHYLMQDLIKEDSELSDRYYKYFVNNSVVKKGKIEDILNELIEASLWTKR